MFSPRPLQNPIFESNAVRTLPNGVPRFADCVKRASLHASFAISRSLNFCTLPVDVFGTSVKTMRRGALK
jgi:hypothetical protein